MKRTKHHKQKSAVSHMFLAITATGFFVLACNSLSYQQQKVDNANKQSAQLAELIEATNCDPRVKNRDGCNEVKPVILSSDKKKRKITSKDEEFWDFTKQQKTMAYLYGGE